MEVTSFFGWFIRRDDVKLTRKYMIYIRAINSMNIEYVCNAAWVHISTKMMWNATVQKEVNSAASPKHDVSIALHCVTAQPPITVVYFRDWNCTRMALGIEDQHQPDRSDDGFWDISQSIQDIGESNTHNIIAGSRPWYSSPNNKVGQRPQLSHNGSLTIGACIL